MHTQNDQEKSSLWTVEHILLFLNVDYYAFFEYETNRLDFKMQFHLNVEKPSTKNKYIYYTKIIKTISELPWTHQISFAIDRKATKQW